METSLIIKRFRNAKIFKPSVSKLKKEKSLKLRRLTKILKKRVEDRSEEEDKFISESSSLIETVEKRIKQSLLEKERSFEKEDQIEILKQKCFLLAQAIRNSTHLVVYTGAGISTSAKILDYRGPNGVWTQLYKTGKINQGPIHDLVLAEPTFTHMALVKLFENNMLDHVVSQNCDGLHLRSGFPLNRLSEIHGNMFIEVCSKCAKLYYRDFDVTERTGLHRHKTNRKCKECPEQTGELLDTIVHFGEKGRSEHPLNWNLAYNAVKQSDMILCLGTSLKILKKYQCLWPKKIKAKPDLYIVNLQWTPKDSQAKLKINGKCDMVMRILMEYLSISVEKYNKNLDPLYNLYVPLTDEELTSCNKIQLFQNSESQKLKLKNEAINIPGWYGKGLKTKRK